MRLRVVLVIACTGLCACQDPTFPQSCLTGTRDPGPGPWVDVKFVESLHVRACDGELRSWMGENLSGINLTMRQIGVTRVDPLITGESIDPSMLSWTRLSFSAHADLDAAVSKLLARREVKYAYVVSDVVPPPP